ncbi:MAG: hypothetical protein Q9166_000132 [cf. Caloplaca sp. 2 TL-2023]
MSTGPPYSVAQTTANCCPSSSVITVPFNAGQLLRSRVLVVVGTDVVVVAAVELDVEVLTKVGIALVVFTATVLSVEVLFLDEVGGAVTVTNIVLKLAGYVGIKLAELEVLEFADGTGKSPDVGREEMLRLVDGVGGPDVKDGVGIPDVAVREVMRLFEGVGKLELGRRVMLELTDSVGKPDVTSEELRFPVGLGSNPELGRIVEVRLKVGTGGKTELGPVTVGKRVVELKETVGVRLKKEVKLRVGAIVGRVPDEAKVFERDTNELKLGIEGETLEIREPTTLEPVPVGTVTDGIVVEGGMGMTETVDEIVVDGGGLPCRVRTWVVVPVVT